MSRVSAATTTSSDGAPLPVSVEAVEGVPAHGQGRRVVGEVDQQRGFAVARRRGDCQQALVLYRGQLLAQPIARHQLRRALRHAHLIREVYHRIAFFAPMAHGTRGLSSLAMNAVLRWWLQLYRAITINLLI
jgi:hypothetical protein